MKGEQQSHENDGIKIKSSGANISLRALFIESKFKSVLALDFLSQVCYLILTSAGCRVFLLDDRHAIKLAMSPEVSPRGPIHRAASRRLIAFR